MNILYCVLKEKENKMTMILKIGKRDNSGYWKEEGYSGEVKFKGNGGGYLGETIEEIIETLEGWGMAETDNLLIQHSYDAHLNMISPEILENLTCDIKKKYPNIEISEDFLFFD